MKFSISDRNSDPARLADFFSANLTESYISHSELQGYRATSPGHWAQNIASVLQKEIAERLGDKHDHFPVGKEWKGVIEGREEGRLVGIGLVTLSFASATPYGIIEDIVVDNSLRGGGRGRSMMVWILEEFARAGARRAFLESGLHNDKAHHLFEELGFASVSIVMMRDL